MSLKVDDMDLIQVNKSLENNHLIEIRNITHIELYDRRNIAELEILGNKWNTLQDMGPDPLRISLWGEFIGKDALKSLEFLQSKFDMHNPFEFSSNLFCMEEVKQVIINDFYLEQVAGLTNKYRYHLMLTEYKN